MYYLNGDLELHDPNLPDIQKLYNRYLQEKYRIGRRAAQGVGPYAAGSPDGQFDHSFRQG
jgi:hypothetical protein